MTSPKKSKILNFKHAQNRKFNEENVVEFTTDDEELTFEFELEEDETGEYSLNKKSDYFLTYMLILLG